MYSATSCPEHLGILLSRWVSAARNEKAFSPLGKNTEPKEKSSDEPFSSVKADRDASEMRLSDIINKMETDRDASDKRLLERINKMNTEMDAHGDYRDAAGKRLLDTIREDREYYMQQMKEDRKHCMSKCPSPMREFDKEIENKQNIAKKFY